MSFRPRAKAARSAPDPGRPRNSNPGAFADATGFFISARACPDPALPIRRRAVRGRFAAVSNPRDRPDMTGPMDRSLSSATAGSRDMARAVRVRSGIGDRTVPVCPSAAGSGCLRGLIARESVVGRRGRNCGKCAKRVYAPPFRQRKAHRAVRLRHRSVRRPTWPVMAGIYPVLSPPVFWVRDETCTHKNP